MRGDCGGVITVMYNSMPLEELGELPTSFGYWPKDFGPRGVIDETPFSTRLLLPALHPFEARDLASAPD